MAGGIPESLMSLRASLSENEDMSVAGALDACSKVLKGTLRVYTTSSDSSGLNFDGIGCQKMSKSYISPRQKKAVFDKFYCHDCLIFVLWNIVRKELLLF